MPPVAVVTDTTHHMPQARDQLVEGGIARERVVVLGSVIGAHVGPGLMGVSGIKRRLLFPGG